MIIDFHTHTFPDKIAGKTISFLSEKGKVKAYLDGTTGSLKRSMKESGTDISVVLPVATAPSQCEKINSLSANSNGKDGLYFAGAVHPECDNIDEILDKIKSYGLFGIKIHPDYQGVYFNDERYVEIIKKASLRGLYTVTHAGVDVGYKNDVHCTPDMVLEVLDKLKGIADNKLILAHMGGCDLPGEVLKKLAGKPVYMDTAFVLDRYKDDCLNIINAHGADKILFATDSPWAEQKKYIDILNGYGLSEAQKERIFYLNAKKILRI